jgi:hypothetical protein
MAHKGTPDTLETLWQGWRAGDITREHALAMAANSVVTSTLTAAVVQKLNAFATDLVWRDWEGAVFAQELTLAAVNALPQSPSTTTMRQSAEFEWLEVVTRAVWQVPDGRLFKKAVEVGEQLATQSGASGDKVLQAKTLYRLGVLHLDPYMSGRNYANYNIQLRDWRAALHDYYGDKLAGVAHEELYPPEPAQSIEIAASYLRRAADLGTGIDKAFSLKALGQALESRRALDLPVDREEVAHCYHAALALFNPEPASFIECASLIGGLQRLGKPFPESYLDALLKIPLPDFERQTNHLLAVRLGMQLLQIVAKDDPRAALLRSQQLLPLLRLPSDEQSRIFVYSQQVAWIIAVHPQEKGIQLLRLAQKSQSKNAEAQGLEWLAQFVAENPQLTREFQRAILSLRATLHGGEASNAYDAGRLVAAAEEDAKALRDFITLGFESEAMMYFRRFGNLLEHENADEELAKRLVVTLVDVSLRAQAMLGDKATRLIQTLCHLLMQRIAISPMLRGEEFGSLPSPPAGTPSIRAISHFKFNPSLALMLLHVAKGLRFAAAATTGVRYDWHADPEGLALLDAIAEAAKAVLPEVPVDDASALEDTIFLAAYIGPGERDTGDTARDILHNRQRAYDKHVNRRIVEQLSEIGELMSLPKEPTKLFMDLYPTPKVAESAIDDRTVLVNYYLGESSQGTIAVYILAFTKDGPWGASCHAKGIPSGYVKLGHHGREAVVTLFGAEIQRLLESVKASPWGAIVDSEAARILEHEANFYLGPLWQFLSAQQKKGRDHLCLVPHGPLHFHPLHLLGPPDKPLAEDWIVTYLPNLRLLTRQKAPAALSQATGKHSVAAIGVSFGETAPHNQEAIPQAAKEARAIAKLFGVEPLVDDTATKTAVIHALQQSRYVHIATHGAQCLHAPAFHQLYVTPDDGSDGIINAYEILALDLKHVECLTLSACETSLGRFDEADDLRGLPASFFTAGVATVVGTLWPVETNASAYFFTQFYEATKKGAGRLDAFGNAQRSTRRKYPKYRDWGPFYLAGDWR